LDQKDIRKIVDIELKDLITRIVKLGYHITITEKAKDFLSEKGFDSKYGARPLNRAIQKHVEDLIAEHVVNNSIKEGDEIIVNQNEEGTQLKLEIKQKTEASS
jgi:ATP-dependent Clp protease ATP-binding subunit ClpC